MGRAVDHQKHNVLNFLLKQEEFDINDLHPKEDYTNFHYSLWKSDVYSTRIVLKSGKAALEMTADFEMTLLHIAAFRNNTLTVGDLLMCGADATAATTRINYDKLAEELRGEFPEFEYLNGQKSLTALHMAAYHLNRDMINLLYDYGAEVDVRIIMGIHP